MRMGRTMLLGLAATALVAGCKDFWKAPASSGSGSGGSGNTSGALYVINQKTAQLVGFTLTSATAAPSAVSGSPYTLAAIPLALAISPSGNFLYVSTAAGIYLYTIGSTGSLTLGNGGQVISADPATAMHVDATGQWLLESVTGLGSLNAIPIVSTSGLYNTSISVQSISLSSTTVQQIAVSPANSSSPYVFVAMGTGGTAVIPFAAANTNPLGSVATISVLHSGGGDNAVAVDPTNRLLYVGETVAVSGTQTGGLRAFTIGSTQIAEISGSPFTTAGTGPSAILPTTNYVYVANRAVSGSSTGNGNITAFSIASNAGVYSLSTVATTSAGVSTVGLAQDSTSTYVVAVNFGGPDLGIYTIDATTPGKLDLGTTAATGSDPVQAAAIVAIP